MGGLLWHVLTGTSDGENRVRILRTLDERPRNANRLAEALDRHYETVRHHLGVLVEHDIVTDTGDDYGAVYLLSGRARRNWGLVEEILEHDDRRSTGPRE
ncbi:winged helix-turn-helix domain-containing protein [Halomarina ordinaria]|uniref:Helix-turn-helix domain-containing protein n=1 Tax=Halomarina ordinaria TaxID=3033939 RepID=A0ABD5UBR4_9EURY|nr:winged helix-turn-helix domain-containing protein [Halomarina sp. PSRA2]